MTKKKKKDVSHLRSSTASNLVLCELLYRLVMIAKDHSHHLSTRTYFIYNQVCNRITI